MPNPRKIIILVTIAVCSVAIASAQTSGKIGFLNFSLAMQATDEAKAEIDEIQKFMEAKQTESDTRFNEVARLKEDLNVKSRSLNPEALGDLQRQVEDSEIALRRFQQDTQNQINQRRDSVLQKFGPKMQAVINEFAQSNGFAVIFLLDSVQYGYFDPSLDLTDQISKIYNQRHGIPTTAVNSPPPSN